MEEIKACDGEAPFLEISGVCSTIPLPLLPGPLRPREVVRVSIYGSSKFIWKLFVFNKNTWGYVNVYKQMTINKYR